MKSLSQLVVVAALCSSVAAPLLAQARTTVTTSELDAAVTGRPTDARQAVQAFLATDQVKTVAGQMGVDVSSLSARVAVLDPASLSQLAQGTAADPNLAGGSGTVVISTTAVIIALLVIIILVR